MGQPALRLQAVRLHRHSSKQHNCQQLAVHQLQVQQLLQLQLLPPSYLAAVLHQLLTVLVQLAGLHRASLRAPHLVQHTASLHSRQQHSQHSASRLSLAPQLLPQTLLKQLLNNPEMAPTFCLRECPRLVGHKQLHTAQLFLPPHLRSLYTLLLVKSTQMVQGLDCILRQALLNTPAAEAMSVGQGSMAGLFLAALTPGAPGLPFASSPTRRSGLSLVRHNHISTVNASTIMTPTCHIACLPFLKPLFPAVKDALRHNHKSKRSDQLQFCMLWTEHNTVHLCLHLVLILAHCFPGFSTAKTAGTGPTCQGSHGVNRGARQGGSSSRAGPATREHGFRQARLPGCWQAVHTGGLVNHTCGTQTPGEQGLAATVCCHEILEHEGSGMYEQLCAVCLLAVRGAIT